MLKNTEVSVVDSEQGWYKIVLDDGKTGYIYTPMLKARIKMVFTFNYSAKFRLLIVLLSFIIILTSCTGPYSVPKKEEEIKIRELYLKKVLKKKKTSKQMSKSQN